MAESSAKQDRADRKLAKYISRRSLAIGITVLAVVLSLRSSMGPDRRMRIGAFVLSWAGRLASSRRTT
jgi:hypothetical protein